MDRLCALSPETSAVANNLDCSIDLSSTTYLLILSNRRILNTNFRGFTQFSTLSLGDKTV